MSFSALFEFEACPLCWALTRADYDGLWSGDGYPRRLNTASIRGQVVHRVVELVAARSRSEISTELGARILGVVRNAGGFTSLIDSALHDVLIRYEDNPRAARILSQFQTGELQLPSAVRTQVQSLLRGLSNYPATNSPPTVESTDSPKRRPLSQGLYSEVSVLVKQFNWFGKIDLVSISSDGAALEDIKTGIEKDADVEQIIVYAWLWWRDTARNPDLNLPTRLRLRYVDRVVDVPFPNESDLLALENTILERTSRMSSVIVSNRFEPRPDVDTCRYCDVRQLCDAFWQDQSDQREFVPDRSIDIEVRFIRALSESAWVVETPKTNLDKATTYRLRGALPKPPVPTGTRLRILGVVLREPDPGGLGDEVATLQLRNHSELFLVS